MPHWTRVQAGIAAAGAQRRRCRVAIWVILWRHEADQRFWWFYDRRFHQLRNSFRRLHRWSCCIYSAWRLWRWRLWVSNLRRLNWFEIIWNGRVFNVGVRRCSCSGGWCWLDRWEFRVDRWNLSFTFRQRWLNGDCRDLLAFCVVGRWRWIFRDFRRTENESICKKKLDK